MMCGLMMIGKLYKLKTFFVRGKIGMNSHDKDIVINTVKVVVDLMDNPCSFRKFLENLGLEGKDYEELYKAGGMYLTNIANTLEELDLK